MKTFAIVASDGSITNRIVIDSGQDWRSPEGGALIEVGPDTPLLIGGYYRDGIYTPPPAPDLPAPPGPSSISDRQFFHQLAIVGIITQDDALAANAAVIPPPLLAIIDAMPAEQQFAAKMLVSGATVFERQHPMTIAIGTAYGWNDAQIDDFFRAAATL